MIKDLTRIYENLDCNRKEDGKVIMHFSNPTAIKLTSEGMPYVPLTLDCLPGLYKDFQRREKEKRRDKENPIKEDTQEARELPRELNTPQAKEILQRCIDSGHLDKDFQPIKGTTTNGQLFYIALYTSYMLWNTARWKPFERLWGAPHLQQEKVWLMAQWRKESIDALFSKDIIEKALKLG